MKGLMSSFLLSAFLFGAGCRGLRECHPVGDYCDGDCSAVEGGCESSCAVQCRPARPRRLKPACETQAPCVAAPQPCQPTTQVPQPTPAPAPAPATPRVGEPVKTPVREEVVEKRVEQQQTQTRGGVAQDILLVPKTVFVPYMAQVPLAPARITSVTQVSTTGVQSRELVEQRFAEQRVAEQRLGERVETRSTSLNEELLRTLKAVNERLDTIETQQRKQAAQFQGATCPTPIPGLPKAPCNDTILIP